MISKGKCTEDVDVSHGCAKLPRDQDDQDDQGPQLRRLGSISPVSVPRHSGAFVQRSVAPETAVVLAVLRLRGVMSLGRCNLHSMMTVVG